MSGRAVRAVPVDEISERLALGWWWVTAANPSCAPWCGRVHAGDEFATSGGLFCSGQIAVAPDFAISVEQAQLASEDSEDGLGVINRTVSVMIRAEDVAPERVGALTRALRSAQLVARGTDA